MIHYGKSAELNGCSIEWIREYLDTYPKSNKRVITICDTCGGEREVTFAAITDRCQSCVMKSHTRTPEHCAALSVSGMGHPMSTDRRLLLAKSMKKSDAHKKSIAKQIGGQDIINHHYIYDHDDLRKYTTEMTRSRHVWLHHTMKRSGIKIPHINIKVVL